MLSIGSNLLSKKNGLKSRDTVPLRQCFLIFLKIYSVYPFLWMFAIKLPLTLQNIKKDNKIAKGYKQKALTFKR